MRATLTLQRAEREVINPGFGSVGQKSYSPRRAKWISVQGTHFNEQFTQENRAIKIALSAGADSRNRVWQSQSTAKVTASVSHDASIASVIPYDGPQTITPFRAEWDALLRTSEHVNALYQSPEYFELPSFLIWQHELFCANP